MIRYKRGTKLWLISAILMLVALLCSVNVTGAWFTAGDGLKIECTVTIGQFNLNIYQEIDGTKTKILSNTDNETADTKSYVDLTNADDSGLREILPDTTYDLVLWLKNEDKGTDSFNLRYKINLVACGKTTETRILNAIWAGNDTSFTLVNGWYYYGTSATALNEFSSSTELKMCTSFNIPYSEFYNNNFNGENVKIEIVVECSDTTVFDSAG